MRLTRAQAAALQDTCSHDGEMRHSTSEQHSILSLRSDTGHEGVASHGSMEDFRQSTQSTKSKKGSKRGKKHLELSPEDLHVDASDHISQDNRNEASFSVTPLRTPSAGKTPVLGAVEHATDQTRPGSPDIEFSKSILKPKSQAKQLLAKEKMGMRSSSNKENVQPGSPATATVATPTQQVNVSNDIARAAGEPEETAVNTEKETELQETHEEEQLQHADVGNTSNETAKPQTPGRTNPVNNETTLPITAAERSEAHTASNEQALQSPITDVTNETTKSAQNAKQTTAPSSLSRGPTHQSVKSRVPSGQAGMPHSKPQPVPLSFPTPPPPAKSIRPPTKPSFALPGEAVAARLKAAKEARLASAGSTSGSTASASTTASRTTSTNRARPSIPPTTKPLGSIGPADVAKRPAFKARPAPKMTAPATVVRQTKASQARQSLMNGTSGLERSSSVRAADTTKPRQSLATSARRNSAMPLSRASLAPVPARSRPQSVIISSAAASADPRRHSVVADGSSKGKEVFRRAAIEQAELERKRKEKETAAKAAREEAARRGREASKAWAEKRKAAQASTTVSNGARDKVVIGNSAA